MVKFPQFKIDRADGQNEEEGRAAQKDENEPAGAAAAAAANIPDVPQERNDPRHPREILKDLEDAAIFDQHRHHAAAAALELAGNGGNEADIAAVVNYIQVLAPDTSDEEEEEDEDQPDLNITFENPNVVIAAAYFCHDKLLEFVRQNLNAGVDTLQDCRSIQLHLSAIRNLALRMCDRMGVQNIEEAIQQGHDVQIMPNEENGDNAQDNPDK